ncbi:L-proline--[L-prolyl-carrier protein] ligase [Pseudomonas sp. LD120]|uniref:L-proline--[L-prolyl-carrier protein] ligase n=1 Tax=Pseudomonas sp. LD120 TaxID=485751 RepID=UPI00135745DC|nr:L-proline--[L-prolyl-carrier protein] ligase [Pseudomonas sp. LD120]KAF0866418.1 amino acid adenylation domain-containing protein [Pseudomonas sp. LD120]
MKLLHERMLHSAARYPRQAAVVDEQNVLSYEALAQRTEEWVATLCALGVSQGQRILLWANKSVELVAIMHAALRLGVVYVPVDPLSPVSRLEKIARDSQAVLVLCTDARLEEIAGCELGQVQCVVLDEPANARYWRNIDTRSVAVPTPDIQPDDLAYILYTSGSTGMPKGVSLSHTNALAFVDWACERFSFQAGERFANHAPLHFDLSVLDIYGALNVGGTLCLVPESIAFSPRLLTDFIRLHEIRIWYSVPSVLMMMMHDGGLLSDIQDTLRVLLFAGEPFPIKHLRELRAAYPEVRLANLFGPTETNVCTAFEVGAIHPERLLPVPIGTAASGNQVWAQRPDGSRCAVDEEGELVVQGPTVMLGYFAMPAQQGPYKTGDMVRQRADGNYEYLGRRDDMLKVRGNRIERGEVEAALLAHPQVSEAAVLVVGEGMNAQLWGVLVPQAGDNLSLIDLKRHCAQRLPRYMIIDKMLCLDALPRNANGKVDRFALTRQLEG